MFKCDICKVTSKPNTPSHKIMVDDRNVMYENFIRDSKGNIVRDYNGKRQTKVSSGHEIAKELVVCDICYKKMYPSQKKRGNIIIRKKETLSSKVKP